LLEFNCPDGIAQCAAIVKKGGVIVFPTDTIYGIGCDPWNDAAVGRIFSIKGRDEGKPLPVLVSDVRTAEKLADLGETGRLLASRFWPGALTIVAPLLDNRGVSGKVTAGKKSLAVRVPANDCTLALLKQCSFIVGTSANLSGKKTCMTARQVRESGLEGYDALLAVTGALGGKESTIVDITGPKPTIARHGAIAASDIDAVLEQLK
jgi:L-threonylcarbamoyladenylate synthase